MRTDLLETAQPDGLKTTPIGRWALDKYRLVSLYGRLFSTAMKRKWAMRAYIDLYAGSGFSELEETRQIYWGSPLLALAVPDPFDKYLFCDRKPESVQALRERVERFFPSAETQFVTGDCNERIIEIVDHIPRGSSALSFCFADPFDLSIHFSTIEVLARRRMDFLFVLALNMDANRNVAHYTSQENTKIDTFLGLPNWRQLWQEAESQGMRFPRFLAEQFSTQMEHIGYLPVPFHKMKQIRSDLRNLPLYHLALFSKHPLAFQFWGQVLRYGTDQLPLDYDS
jgi:three-Cys-motif partner protein